MANVREGLRGNDGNGWARPMTEAFGTRVCAAFQEAWGVEMRQVFFEVEGTFWFERVDGRLFDLRQSDWLAGMAASDVASRAAALEIYGTVQEVQNAEAPVA